MGGRKVVSFFHCHLQYRVVITLYYFIGQWDPLREPASSVPSFIPWQGPFHISLNVEESTVLLFRPVFEKLYKKLFGQNKVIGPLQFTITWYKNRHAGEQTAHWEIQMKATLLNILLFWMFQWAACSPAWRFLYHVIINYKGPIVDLFLDLQLIWNLPTYIYKTFVLPWKRELHTSLTAFSTT